MNSACRNWRGLARRNGSFRRIDWGGVVDGRVRSGAGCLRETAAGHERSAAASRTGRSTLVWTARGSHCRRTRPSARQCSTGSACQISLIAPCCYISERTFISRCLLGQSFRLTTSLLCHCLNYSPLPRSRYISSGTNPLFLRPCETNSCLLIPIPWMFTKS